MDQVIAFMEQVNKQFVIGGATAQEQSNAMTSLHRQWRRVRFVVKN